MTDDEVRVVAQRVAARLGNLSVLVKRGEWAEAHRHARHGIELLIQFQEAIESDPQTTAPIPEPPPWPEADPDELRLIMRRHGFR